jgi:hypothetical protein
MEMTINNNKKIKKSATNRSMEMTINNNKNKLKSAKNRSMMEVQWL